MNTSLIKRWLAEQAATPRRAALAALLLALTVFVGSALAASGNLVKNGSFEKDTDGDGIPNAWLFSSETPTSGDKKVCNQSYAGACSFKFVGDTVNKDIFQYVDFIPGNTDDKITVSLWAKSKDIVVGAGAYRMDVTIHHDDEDSTDVESASFDPGTTNWRRYEVSLTATEDYNYFTVAIIFDVDSGKAWFDKVKLVGP
jgi:hypothetical protein